VLVVALHVSGQHDHWQSVADWSLSQIRCVDTGMNLIIV